MPNLTPVRPTTSPLTAPVPGYPTPLPLLHAPGRTQDLGQDQLRMRVPARSPLPRDQILFLGLNPAAAQELRALRQAGAKVEAIMSENGRSMGHNLAEATGRAAFVAGLGLGDPARSRALSALLAEADDHGRDELAAIARVWVRAERGLSVPGRLVLSGHSDGLTIWSESGRGSLSLAAIGRLANIFPVAAAQIEDLHLSGCNTGYRSNAQFWQEYFPALATFWGYTHTAPAGSNGAPAHLKAWEAATRGDTARLGRTPIVRSLARVARADNLALWSRRGDYQSALPPKGIDLSEIEQVVSRYRLGEALSTHPQSGPLKQAYDALQTLRGEDASGRYDRLIGQSLRLRFAVQIGANFQLAYGTMLGECFRELGLSAPDFGRLDRRQALLAIRHYKDAFAAKGGELPEARQERHEKVQTLFHHFEQMSPDFFAPEWTDPLNADGLSQARADFERLEALPPPSLFPGWPGLFPGLLPGLFPGIGAGLVSDLNTDLNQGSQGGLNAGFGHGLTLPQIGRETRPGYGFGAAGLRLPGLESATPELRLVHPN